MDERNDEQEEQPTAPLPPWTEPEATSPMAPPPEPVSTPGDGGVTQAHWAPATDEEPAGTAGGREPEGGASGVQPEGAVPGYGPEVHPPFGYGPGAYGGYQPPGYGPVGYGQAAFGPGSYGPGGYAPDTGAAGAYPPGPYAFGAYPPSYGPTADQPAGPGRPKRGRKAVAIVAAALVLLGAAGGVGIAYVSRTGQGTTAGLATSPAGHTLTTAQIAAAVDPAVVDINTNLGEGTGMIATSNGEIITNNHVVEGASTINVVIENRGTYKATVVGTDAAADVAVLQLSGVKGLPTVRFGNSSTLKIGSSVVAIGNAGGQGFPSTVTAGAVTALGRTITASDQNGVSESLRPDPDGRPDRARELRWTIGQLLRAGHRHGHRRRERGRSPADRFRPPDRQGADDCE